MEPKELLDLLREWYKAKMQKKPTVLIAVICCLTWLATCAIIGKAALLLLIPLFILAIIKTVD